VQGIASVPRALRGAAAAYNPVVRAGASGLSRLNCNDAEYVGTRTIVDV
jgi:hypothetical protein